MIGRGRAAVVLLRERLRAQAGQGTVEYVALILLVAAVMAAVVAATTNKSEGATIAKKVTDELRSAIDSGGTERRPPPLASCGRVRAAPASPPAPAGVPGSRRLRWAPCPRRPTDT